MNTIRFVADDLQLFAAASGDRNPLHLSDEYARKTPFGEPVVYGMLGAIAVIGQAPRVPGTTLAALSLDFRNPLFCGVDYQVTFSEKKPGQVKFSVGDAGRSIFTGSLTYQPIEAVSQVVWGGPANHLAEAQRRTADQLIPGLEAAGKYGPGAGFDELVKRWKLDDSALTRSQLAVLLWASYLVGMQLPGERAVFSQLRLQFEEQGTEGELPLSYHAQVADFDDRFDRLSVNAELKWGGALCARAELAAFVRHDSPRLDLPALTEQLPRSSALSGKTALVCGGSRGLGAALVAGLVSQGCDVMLNYRSSTAEAEHLRESLREEPGQISMAPGNAGDANWCRELRDDLTERDQRLDFLVCTATPPIRNLGLGLESVDRMRAFLDESFSLTCVPLAGLRDMLEATAGRVVLISSEYAAPAMPEVPADLLHYVSAKYAVEGFVRALAAQSPSTHFLVVRPPRLLTDQTNTFGAREGTIGVEGVAAQIVQRMISPTAASNFDVVELSDGQ